MEAEYPRQRWRLAFAIFLLALPGVIFYIILFRMLVNLPILDDYQIVLETTNILSQTHGFVSKLGVVFLHQHNGYKLVFENIVVSLMYLATGQIVFLPLVVLGNAFALFIFLVVAGMAKMTTSDPAERLILLSPVAYLLLQLQYASALDFASSSLQHLAVVFFALLTIFLLSRGTRWAFVGGCAASLLAIASSPNGFFVAPVGALLLLQARSWRRLLGWTGMFVVALVLYLVQYDKDVPRDGGTSGGVAQLARHINVPYALSFLGASVARYENALPGVLLGIVLCGVVCFALYRGYFRQNPAVFYSMIFVVLNAVAVSALRSDSGVAQSLASRYRTYSNMMLAFSYLFLMENVLPGWKSVRLRRGAVAGALVLSMAFCVVSDVAGARFLAEKKLILTRSYATQWLHQQPGSVPSDGELKVNPALRRQLETGVYNVDLRILRDSVRLGVYRPPSTAE
jgi:hypothetical protein